MKLFVALLVSLLLPALAKSADPNEIQLFVVTISQIHAGKGVESSELWDTNWNRAVPGEHFIRLDTAQYELYDGQKISVAVISDGVVKSADGSRTVKAWKVAPGRKVKLH